ncbi:hypothetical protein SAMN02745132_04052 [Enterovibrio nigricans DSM 22720]|uniref:Uncharacterized protein n=1 Tax=Enterovibrio nigricans DSM 22720 TaxID=1121868 RepID=A0A1T4VM30_9GAMM|nr:hypothetical protein SAMN02745132_04052 [Enterovibrio nigricans DSM 22720]
MRPLCSLLDLYDVMLLRFIEGSHLRHLRATVNDVSGEVLRVIRENKGLESE